MSIPTSHDRSAAVADLLAFVGELRAAYNRIRIATTTLELGGVVDPVPLWEAADCAVRGCRGAASRLRDALAAESPVNVSGEEQARQIYNNAQDAICATRVWAGLVRAGDPEKANEARFELNLAVVPICVNGDLIAEAFPAGTVPGSGATPPESDLDAVNARQLASPSRTRKRDPEGTEKKVVSALVDDRSLFGASHRQVAAAAGLSKGAVSAAIERILNRTNPDDTGMAIVKAHVAEKDRLQGLRKGRDRQSTAPTDRSRDGADLEELGRL